MAQKWGFSPICDPHDFFFKNRALSLLYPYGVLTSCQKLEKTNEWSLEIFKDGHTDTHIPTRTITKDSSGKTGVQKYYIKPN